MKTIVLANQKGGVGKTTTAASLGVGLAQQGKKVLLVDADAQGNLTQMLGWRQPDELSPTLADLMTKTVNEEPIAPGEGILHHASGVDLVPANIELSGLEVTLVNIMSRETVLRQYLSTAASTYDYTIIDCMPSLGMLTINALTAADSVIIPVQGQYLAAKGLEQLKSSDLFMKCRYLDEITGGRGVVFATGTPISNSMVELYTIQRYLQMDALQEQGFQHFDAWAANYGETVTTIELAPEGTGYRAKTCFAKFNNLPELISVFKNVADIQTADMLNLPVPEAHYHNIALKPSEYQKEMVASLAERAEQVRNKQVDSSVDNMLLITNDGRKLALDQRLINPMLPADPESKAVKCAETVFDIWRRTAEKRSTQMIFCDLSTPKSEGIFSVYDDIRSKLVEMGVPENEIAYIHDAKTEAQKKDLFAKVRAGQVRVLLGSTQRMGAGTNCQQKLVALHHLDCPWRPADLQQREGRIIRQGNENAEVDIYSYVTEGTFDAYLYQLVERKQKFIAQIMTSKSPVRSAEDVDDQALSYAEIKALASGNPLIKEKMDLDIEVTKLKLLKSSHLSQRYSMEDAISKTFPKSIAETQERLAGYGADIAAVKVHTAPNEDGFSPMTLAGKVYTEKKAAGAELLVLCQNMLTPEAMQIGFYRGLTLELSFDSFSQEYRLTMIGQLRHVVTLGTDVFGNIQRMDNLLESLPLKEQACREKLSDLHNQLETAKVEVLKPFPREEELQTKLARLEELNALLNMDKREPEVVAETEAPDNSQQSPTRKTTELER